MSAICKSGVEDKNAPALALVWQQASGSRPGIPCWNYLLMTTKDLELNAEDGAFIPENIVGNCRIEIVRRQAKDPPFQPAVSKVHVCMICKLVCRMPVRFRIRLFLCIEPHPPTHAPTVPRTHPRASPPAPRPPARLPTGPPARPHARSRKQFLFEPLFALVHMKRHLKFTRLSSIRNSAEQNMNTWCHEEDTCIVPAEDHAA